MKNYNFHGLTDIGKLRNANEDNVYCVKNKHDEILLLLLDGMGGHNKGDVASKLSIDFIRKKFECKKSIFKSVSEMKKWFYNTLKETNKYILNIASSAAESKGMGTTVVGVLLSNDHGVVANMGDSRCYLLKKSKLKQITSDDTYVNYLLENGKITKEEYEKYDKKNVLINALGAYENFSVKIDEISDFDALLLCSDGLYNMLKHEVIENVMLSNEPINNKCQHLIDLANESGGKDNIGVLICEVI